MKNVFFLCCILAITACSKDKVKISGKIEGNPKGMIYLDEVDVYSTLVVDSVKLNKSGKFSFTYNTKEACFLQLRLSPDKTIVLFPIPGEHLKVNADAGNIVGSLKIEGSHDSEQINKLIEMLTEMRSKLDSISKDYEKASSDSIRQALNKKYQEILEIHRRSSIAYVLTNYNSLSSIYALYQQYMPGYYLFYKTTDLQYFKILSDSLTKYHPGSKHVEALKAYTNKLIGDYKAQVILEKANTTVGLPDIKLPDFSGDTAKLSSLKGKYVLLSFWTSGNQVCVSQNIELKKIYDKFRKKGFEIYQVSFDNSRETWQRAVKFDELPWISVIDDNGNSSVAGNYNVQQLPSNYLIDKNSTSILAKNLSPVQLQNKLEDLYN